MKKYKREIGFYFLFLLALALLISSIIVAHQIFQNWLALKNYALEKIPYSAAKDWDFNFLYYWNNSGKALNIQELFSRQVITFQPAQSNSFYNIIISFLEQSDNSVRNDTSTVLNPLAIRGFVNAFLEFSKTIQIFTFLISVFLITISISLIYWLVLVIDYWKKHNGYRLLIVNLIFLFNFVSIIPIEILHHFKPENKFKNLWFERVEKYPPFIWYKRIYNFFLPFENLEFKNNIVSIKNVYYSYSNAHNYLRHLKDVIKLAVKQKPYKEKDHIYKKKKTKFSKWLTLISSKLVRKNEDILKNINLDIKNGSFTTIIGPNGCGKSTLVQILVGVQKYFLGTIYWNNKNIYRISRKSFSKNVSYIPQILNIPEQINVYDFVSFGRMPYRKSFSKISEEDKRIILECLKATDTLQFSHKKMDELSGGQRQKVIIATILAQKSQIIILDEPTSYLDIKNQYFLLETLKKLNQEGKTIITILHDLNQAISYSSELIILKDGELVNQGPPNQVINQKTLNDVFQISALIEEINGLPYISNIRKI